LVYLGGERRLAGGIQFVAGAQRIEIASEPDAGVGACSSRMTLQSFVSIAGWMAALLILGAYSLLSFGKISPSSWVYQAMNIVGAAGFIINCAYNNAWPSVALNVVWMGIAFYALRRNARQGG